MPSLVAPAHRLGQNYLSLFESESCPVTAQIAVCLYRWVRVSALVHNVFFCTSPRLAIAGLVEGSA